MNPKVLARLSGADTALVVKWLNKITKAMGNDVFGRLLLDEPVRRDVSAKKHAVDVTSEFKPIFDGAWRFLYRLEACPPKQVIAKLNEKLPGKRLQSCP